MEIIRLIDRIFDKLKRDPFLILSENDLACQMYRELIRDDTKRVFTEWSVKKQTKEPGTTRIGRRQFDLVICDRNAIAYKGGNDIHIPYFKKIIELKVHWQTTGKHMFNKIEAGDYKKLKTFGKDIVEKKYMIAFNLFKKDVPKERRIEMKEKMERHNIIFIYKFLDTRELM